MVGQGDLYLSDFCSITTPFHTIAMIKLQEFFYILIVGCLLRASIKWFTVLAAGAPSVSIAVKWQT
jgi:hypothetical protein